MDAFVQKMEILPVNDLDIALHDFVNKDDKMAFYSCLLSNLEETRVSNVIPFTCIFGFSGNTNLVDDVEVVEVYSHICRVLLLKL